MPDVVPDKLICDVPALKVNPVVVPKFNAGELLKEQVIVELFKLIVLVFELLEFKNVHEIA